MFMKMKRIKISVKLTANSTYDVYSKNQDLILRAIYARIDRTMFAADIQKPHLMAMAKRLVTLIPYVFSP